MTAHPSLLTPTAEPGVYILRFDNSSMESFNTCARKAQYSCVFKRRPAGVDAALHFGGIVHECMEIRAQAMLVPNPFWESEQAKHLVRRFEAVPQGPDEWRTPDVGINLLRAYNTQYPIELEPFTIVPGTIEMPFSVFIGHMDVDADLELRPGEIIHVKRLLCYWTGRIDNLISLDGSKFIHDYKTASVLGPTYFEDYDLSAQMIGYVWAARQLGHTDTVGLYLDVLGNRRPTKTGKSIELHRQRYYYSDEHIEEWRVDTFTSLSDFVEYLIRAYFPKRTQQHCHGKYGTCEYWNVCNQLPTQRNPVIFSSVYEDDTWSPLDARDSANPTPVA